MGGNPPLREVPRNGDGGSGLRAGSEAAGSVERKLGEQLGQREAEAGEHVFAVEGVGQAQEAVGFGPPIDGGTIFPRD